MDTNQHSSINVTLTPAMCMAVLGEMKALRTQLSPDEVEEYGRHEQCNGHDLVAARFARVAVGEGLSPRKLIEWAGRWADKAEDASNTFEERQVTAKIRGFVASVHRFNFDPDSEDERCELEREVYGFARKESCTAVHAWLAVFEGAVWMTYESTRDDWTEVAVSAAEMVAKLMFHVCSNDAERNEMLIELRALVHAERADRAADLQSLETQGARDTCAVSNHNALGQAELAHDARG